MGLFRRREPAASSFGGADSDLESRVFIVRRKGTRTAFRIAENGTLVVLKEVPAKYATALIYDQDEKRLAPPKPISYHAIYRQLRQESGISASVVNATQTLGAAYGIDEMTASTFGGPTIPLLAALDAALKQDHVELGARPLVVVIHFGTTGQPGCALMVVGINADRTMVGSDLSNNPTDVRAIVVNAMRSMVQAGQLQGLPWDARSGGALTDEAKAAQEGFFTNNVINLSSLSLVEAMNPKLAYPREPMYRGVRRSSLTRIAAVASFLLAAGLGASAVVFDRMSKATQAQTQARLDEVNRKKTEARSKLLERAGGLSQKLTLDPESLFAAANEVYHLGSKVRLDATLERASLTLLVPVTRGRSAPGTDRRMASLARDAEQLLEGLRTPAPHQWQTTGVEVSGDLNDWYVGFVSRPLDSDLLSLIGLGEGTPAAGKPSAPASAQVAKAD